MANGASSLFVIYSRVLELLKKKPNLYNSFEVSYIKNAILSESGDAMYYDEGVREILDELELLPEDENIYLAFIDYIKSKCNISDKHIVEVGGGVFPRLAKRISLEQKSGTITVYDPRLDPEQESTERMILKKEAFNHKTDVSKSDLLIGLMPCKGAEYLIEQALTHNKDFFVWLCEGGPHGDIFDYFEDDNEWLDSTVYYTARRLEDKGQKIKIKKMEDYSPYPIISNI